MNFMLYIPKFHRIESEIHLNFPEIRPIRLGPNFFPKRIPKPWKRADATREQSKWMKPGGG
jgi:hypothetical protein